MVYREATEWLFAQRRQGKRGLGRVKALLERLGHPEEAFSAVHVLGTNGKGSVVAYLEAAFRAMGLAYGAYTSPHLQDFRERIRTHLGRIPEEEVVAFVAWAMGEAWPEPPGFFDLATAMAFHHFQRKGVALAAVEAGVGGGEGRHQHPPPGGPHRAHQRGRGPPGGLGGEPRGRGPGKGRGLPPRGSGGHGGQGDRAAGGRGGGPHPGKPPVRP